MLNTLTPPTRYWQPGELIVIGIFSAMIKLSSLLIALTGGGMNPLSLVLKNLVATSLLVVLVFKVRKFGVLTLFVTVSTLISMLLDGGNIIRLPGALIAGGLCDLVIHFSGGYQKPGALIAGVAVFDLLSRFIALGLSWLTMREQPAMVMVASVIVALGYLGCLMGLFSGLHLSRELTHAGVLRHE
ncbi:MptD family putative ECF transporter S component [Desulfoluna sp.]|uniref:MptD family putative ECF transporter S component n=1 Tax=Desulfoluna sp. TaxID=2045199 RepID=UPI00260BF897|nr:MptD family putative ECF transporter S component [Desulfoluna sp.]